MLDEGEDLTEADVHENLVYTCTCISVKVVTVYLYVDPVSHNSIIETGIKSITKNESYWPHET